MDSPSNWTVMTLPLTEDERIVLRFILDKATKGIGESLKGIEEFEGISTGKAIAALFLLAQQMGVIIPQ